MSGFKRKLRKVRGEPSPAKGRPKKIDWDKLNRNKFDNRLHTKTESRPSQCGLTLEGFFCVLPFGHRGNHKPASEVLW